MFDEMFEEDDQTPMGMVADFVINTKKTGMLVDTIAFIYGKTTDEVQRDIKASKQ